MQASMAKKEEEDKVEYTTFDSLNLALSAKTRKGFWSWLVVTCCLLVALCACCIIMGFKLDRQDTMVIKTVVYNPEPFPAVTLCNLNPYKNSKLSNLPDLAELVKAYEEEVNGGNSDKVDDGEQGGGTKIQVGATDGATDPIGDTTIPTPAMEINSANGNTLAHKGSEAPKVEFVEPDGADGAIETTNRTTKAMLDQTEKADGTTTPTDEADEDTDAATDGPDEDTTPTETPQASSSTNDHKHRRGKRAASVAPLSVSGSPSTCACDQSGSVSASANGLKYTLYKNARVNWQCAFECCANAGSTLAKNLFDKLPCKVKDLMKGQQVWIGAKCAPVKTPGLFDCTTYKSPNSPESTPPSGQQGSPGFAVISNIGDNNTSSLYVTDEDDQALPPICEEIDPATTPSTTPVSYVPSQPSRTSPRASEATANPSQAQDRSSSTGQSGVGTLRTDEEPSGSQATAESNATPAASQGQDISSTSTCACDQSGSVSASANGIKYTLHKNARVNWQCAFECCANVGSTLAKNLFDKLPCKVKDLMKGQQAWIGAKCSNGTAGGPVCTTYQSPSSQESTPSSGQQGSPGFAAISNIDVGNQTSLDVSDDEDQELSPICEEIDSSTTSSGSSASSVRSLQPSTSSPATITSLNQPQDASSNTDPAGLGAFSTGSGLSGSQDTTDSGTDPLQHTSQAQGTSKGISDLQATGATEHITGAASTSNIPDSKQSDGPTVAPTPSTNCNNSTFPSSLKDTLKCLLSNQTWKGDHVSKSSIAEDLVPFAVAPAPPGAAIRSGYTSDETIMQCLYNGKLCYYKNFTLHSDPNYGNCYTFNKLGERKKARTTGAPGGFAVSYQLGVDEYLKFVLFAGMRVVIQDQNLPLFPDIAGFNVAGGSTTSVSMKKVRVKQLSLRQRPCAKDSTDVSPYYYENSNYSTEGCLRSCYQKKVIERCLCGDPRVPLPPDSNYLYCDLSNHTCVSEYYETDDKNCYCPRECQSEFFETTMSVTKWAVNYKTTFASAVVSHTSMKANQIAKLELYFENTIITEYSEQLKYSIFDFLMDFSSVVGLFTGMSVISLFEVANLITYLGGLCGTSACVYKCLTSMYAE